MLIDIINAQIQHIDTIDRIAEVLIKFETSCDWVRYENEAYDRLESHYGLGMCES